MVSLIIIVVKIGFVETLVEVDESDGQATLNISISFPAPDSQVGIMISLIASTMDGSAGMGDIT